MSEHLHRDFASLDSQAYAVVLSAIFVFLLLSISGPLVGEPAAEPVTIAAASSALKCPRL